VTADAFLACIKSNPDVKIVALSCLLTTTMPSLKEIAAAVKASNVKGFKLIVGGAPITQDFANQVGADGYSTDAAGAANLAKKLAS
jgi:methanogenic corrinoid protein MtbC1